MSRHLAATADDVFAVVASPEGQCRIDGSGMLVSALSSDDVLAVGATFIIRMHRMGRDYEMINHVVACDPPRLVAWQPAPGDLETAGDPSRIGVPSGYTWGFRLEPDGDGVTVSEFFDCGPDDNRWILERDQGEWINGRTSVATSMAETLRRLEVEVQRRRGNDQSGVRENDDPVTG